MMIHGSVILNIYMLIKQPKILYIILIIIFGLEYDTIQNLLGMLDMLITLTKAEYLDLLKFG